MFTSIKYLRQLMWKSQLLSTAAELEKTPQFCTWLSPTGNWFWSGLQALQYLQTDVIMMTSSPSAYCSGHPISYRAECITISGFFVSQRQKENKIKRNIQFHANLKNLDSGGIESLKFYTDVSKAQVIWLRMYFKNWRLKVILPFHYMVTVYVCNCALLVFFQKSNWS